MKQIIHTTEAPEAIGTYSQAVRVDNDVYISGQIPLDPATMRLVAGDLKEQTRQVFRNLQAVVKAAGGELTDVVKLTIFMCDLSQFALINEVMAEFFEAPFPARAVVGVVALPKDAAVEADAIMKLSNA
jgi:reactive intermediate/imine deaminase